MASTPVSSLWEPRLPDHCTPTTPLLNALSSYFHTCVPTPLAFASVFFGIMSIVSWLFAQLPQVVKNFRLRSTSGLSAFFLIEWCLGDLSNLVGALLTQQATWQVTLASYYCMVDFILVGQWIWYEHLKHGRSLRRILTTRYHRQFEPHDSKGSRSSSVPTSVVSEFRTPAYNSPTLTQNSENLTTPSQTPSRTIRRAQAPANPLPSPSPRTLLMVSMVVCLCSTTIASPAPLGSAEPLLQSPNKDGPTSTPKETIGTVISWLSALLYLGSRLPQLIKNARRRSTEGLSPLLFLAAFCGNLFYSSSMLCNPLAWRSRVGPYGEHGWAPAEGSTNVAWIANALPFFLGAAGVLVMDASVGLQFWLFRPRDHGSNPTGDGSSDRFVIVVDQRSIDAASSGNVDLPGSASQQPRWRRVSGWMRGWSPGFAALNLRPNTPVMGPTVHANGAVAAGHDGTTRGDRVPSSRAHDGERQPLLAAQRQQQQ